MNELQLDRIEKKLDFLIKFTFDIYIRNPKEIARDIVDMGNLDCKKN